MSLTDITSVEDSMRIFVTGASGWIGSATTRRLIADEHQVAGLARSDRSAAAIAAAGAEPVAGTLEDLDVLAARAADSDAVVHLGFRHDLAFSGDFAGAVATDRAAIDAFGEALAGTGRMLLVASGTLGLAPGRVGTEADSPDPAAHPRIANAYAALALAERGVHPVVVRFAPTVHGEGDHGFIATLAQIARDTGISGYLGDGGNRWAAVHRDDAADLVVRAVGAAPAGAVLHATAETGVPLRAVAEAIGAALGVPAGEIPRERAGEHFRFLAGFIGADSPASSEQTRELLDWQPAGPTLCEDIAAGHYPGGVTAGRD